MTNSSNFDMIRQSMKNNLSRGDYLRALDKISDNLSLIKSNNKDLKSYLTSLGSKKDNLEFTNKINATLTTNGDLFNETDKLIKEFENFDFPNNNDKITNIKQLRLMKSTKDNLESEFKTLTYKINRQNKSIIDSNRNSRMSFPMFNNDKQDSQMQLVIQGNDLLAEERLAAKEEQIKIISTINKDINQMSKKQNEMIFDQGFKINDISNNVETAKLEVKKGAEEMKEASSIASNDKLTTIACYASIIIVVVLFLFMVILPD